MAEEQSKPAPAEVPAGEALMKYSEADMQSVGLPSPGALNALSVFCKSMTGTPFLPRSFADKGNAAGTLLAVVLTGREMGFTPMQSLRAFWLSPDGRLGMYGDAMMAAMLSKGFQPDFEKLDNEVAILVTRRPNFPVYRSEFTIEDAKRAGIYQKDKSVWPKYPKAMLKARVIGDTFRTLGPDLGGGQMYTKEEIIDMEPDELGAFSPAGNGAEPENRFTVGRKPPAGSDAEFSAAGKAAAVETKAAPVETVEAVKPVVETVAVEPEKKPPVVETAKQEEPADTPAADAPRTKACSCVAPACMMLEDGALPGGRFCREGRTLGMVQEPTPAETAPAAATGPQLVQDDAALTLRKQVLGQLNILTDHYKAQSPKTVMSKFNNFFRGVLSVQTLPKDPETFMGLLPALEAAIIADKDAFWKDPTGAGRIESEDRKFIAEKIEAWKWSPAMMALVFKVKYKFGAIAADICEYIETTHKLGAVSPAAAEAFLKMAAVSNEVFRIKPLAKWSQTGYDELLSQMEQRLEKPVDQFTAKELVGMIEIGEKTMAQETASEKSAPAAVEPSPTVGQTKPATAGEQEALWDTEA